MGLLTLASLTACEKQDMTQAITCDEQDISVFSDASKTLYASSCANRQSNAKIFPTMEDFRNDGDTLRGSLNFYTETEGKTLRRLIFQQAPVDCRRSYNTEALLQGDETGFGYRPFPVSIIDECSGNQVTYTFVTQLYAFELEPTLSDQKFGSDTLVVLLLRS